jgi:hypothetical protein
MTLNANFIVTNQFRNGLRFQWKLISMLFWSEELIGNDEICIQGHLYEATNFKMAANKIVKLSMVSDFKNTPRYQFSLQSETIDNLTILLAAILKLVAS